MPAVVPNLAPVIEKARNLSSAVQDGLGSTKRALKHASESVVDAYDDTVVKVKKHPMRSMLITVGVGAGIGIMAGILIGRSMYRRKSLTHYFR